MYICICISDFIYVAHPQSLHSDSSQSAHRLISGLKARAGLEDNAMKRRRRDEERELMRMNGDERE